MKKIVSIALIFLLFIPLSGCGLGGRMMIFDDSSMRADRSLEQILEALESEDRDGISCLFSKQALSDSEDFDGQLDDLFDFFQGSVISWEGTGAIGSSNIDEGNEISKFAPFYLITTDQKEYAIFMIACYKDDTNPDNIGLYTLRVIEAKDKDTLFTDWREMEIPGIYTPGI